MHFFNTESRDYKLFSCVGKVLNNLNGIVEMIFL